MKTLVIAEHDKKLKTSTYQTITAAKQLSNEIELLIVGYECNKILDDAKKIADINKILVADHEVYKHQLAENVAQLISSIATNYSYILAPATTFGKNLLPRVAGLLDVEMLSDVIKIENADTFFRPTYAGNAITKVQLLEKIKLLTIRTTAFASATLDENQNTHVEKIITVINNNLSEFVQHELSVSTRPELTAAKIIVAGGRGLKSAENFRLLEVLADKLGAAIGASRAAVDAGFAPNDYQIGQTGKVVAPELYIAVGISGAIQHLAGMKDSKVIVAINNDAEAPIFAIADYALVSDLFVALKELTECL